MTNEAVVAIGIRLAGLWIFLTQIPQTLRILVAIGASRGSIVTEPVAIPWSFLGFNLLWLALSAAMIYVPLRFAQVLLPNAQHGEGKMGWSPEDLQQTGFSILGLYFLLTALLSTNHWAHFWSQMVRNSNPSVSFGQMDFATLLQLVLQIAIGLWLLFGAKGLGKMLRRVRHAGDLGSSSRGNGPRAEGRPDP